MPFLIWVLSGLAISVAGRVLKPPSEAMDECSEPDTGWDATGLLALGLTLWAVLMIGAPALLLPVKVVSDGPIYHLYFAVRWWKSGSLELIPTPFGETAATYFPANGELWFLWLITALGGDRFARVGQAPFLLLSAMACYGLARRLGARPSTALVAVCWFVTCTPLIIFSFEPNVDTLFTAGYLVSTYFLVRFATGAGRFADLALAGLAAGLALGSKPTGIVFIPPLLVVGLMVIASKRGGYARLMQRSVLLLVSALIPSGYWYGRNAILTGNPLYPAHLELLGWTIWPGWYPRSAMKYSQYYVPLEDMGFLVDILLAVFDARMLPLWVAALAGFWAVRKSESRREDRWVWILSALAVVNVALYWVVIPYRTQQRFMLQGVGLAVVPLARLLDRSRGLRWLAVGLLGLHLVTPWDWPIVPHLSRFTPMAEDLVGMPDSQAEFRQAVRYPLIAARLIGILLSGLLSVVAVFLWARRRRSPSSARPVLAGVSALVAIILAVLSAYFPYQNRRSVFPYFPDYRAAWIALDYYAGSEGARVAYAGTDIPYYLFGRDLRNDVVYVNPDGHPSWRMHDYQRTSEDRGEPRLWDTPRPGWGRLSLDINEWVRNLAEAGVDFLVVARCRADQGPFNLADSEGFPVERVWAEANPSVFTPVYGADPPDSEMKVFRFHREKIRRIEP